MAINKEIIKEEKYKCSKCGSEKLEIKKAIEVGNIFKLKNRFSQAFNFYYTDKDSKAKIILMGCYGIGLSRLMGAIVEVYNDEKGIIWPKEVAPFDIHLIQIEDSKKVNQAVERICRDLQKVKIEVLYDDRKDKTPGEKFVEADLIGIPIRLVVSERTLKQNSVEFKKRSEEKTKLIKTRTLNSYIRKKFVIS